MEPLPFDNKNILELFKNIFLAHGIKGYRDESAYKKILNLSEKDKLGLVPYFFYLIPQELVTGKKDKYTPMKPKIREHLLSIGIHDRDEGLVDIIKRIGDHFYSCQNETNDRKRSISDLRMNSRLYQKFLLQQNNRCNTCGTELDENNQELDHIIPYKLLGDPLDGANWQILCSRCNSGKGGLFTPLQHNEFLNWIYDKKDLEKVSDKLAFMLFVLDKRCHVCGIDVSKSELKVRKRISTGLTVASNMTVTCIKHV